MFRAVQFVLKSGFVANIGMTSEEAHDLLEKWLKGELPTDRRIGSMKSDSRWGILVSEITCISIPATQLPPPGGPAAGLMFAPGTSGLKGG